MERLTSKIEAVPLTHALGSAYIQPGLGTTGEYIIRIKHSALLW